MIMSLILILYCYYYYYYNNIVIARVDINNGYQPGYVINSK